MIVEYRAHVEAELNSDEYVTEKPNHSMKPDKTDSRLHKHPSAKVYDSTEDDNKHLQEIKNSADESAPKFLYPKKKPSVKTKHRGHDIKLRCIAEGKKKRL